jgi:hypothetical protein
MQCPGSDNRIREWPSESLWVLIRSPISGTPVSVGINESIERTVYRLKGYSGQYVQYQNAYHPIHPETEFREYLEKAVTGEIDFFSNEGGLSGEDPRQFQEVALARFIFDDEAIASAP